MRLLRGIVLGLGGLEAVVLLGAGAFLLSGHPDPLAVEIAQGLATLMVIPLVVCILPALILGLFGRWLGFALALEIGWPLLVVIAQVDS